MDNNKKDTTKRDLDNETSIELFLKQNKIVLDPLKILIEHLKEEHKLSSDEIINLLTQKIPKESIPISIFDNKELSALESIVKYLKENLNYNYAKIAFLLNRDQRTIWTTYQNSIKKRRLRLIVKDTKYLIPISIFSDRNFSVLELISEYLHDNYNLKYHEIALLLKRDDRTIWTVYQRARKKYAKQK